MSPLDGLGVGVLCSEILLCFFPVDESKRGNHLRISRSWIDLDCHAKLRNIYHQNGVI